MALAAVFGVGCGMQAHAAEDRAALKLRGVISKSVSVAFASPAEPSGPFDGVNALQFHENTNYAGAYRVYLRDAGGEAPSAAGVFLDGRPVDLRDGRATLIGAGNGRAGETVQRTRTLRWLNADEARSAARDLRLVVQTP